MSKVPIKSRNASSRRLPLSSTAEARDSSRRSSLPRRTTSPSARQLGSAQQLSRTSTASPSQLPLTLQSSIVPPRTANPREIATKIEAQSSNLKLTADERQALISTILTNELALQSKLDAQIKQLFSSPKAEDIQRPKTPSKPAVPAVEKNLIASLMEKRLELEAIRAAQEREILSSAAHTTVADPTPERRAQAQKQQPTVQRNRSRPKSMNSGRRRQSRFGSRTLLTPIPEAR